MNCLELRFLGINIHKLTIESIHRLIESEIKNNNKFIIAHHNLHSLYIYHKDQKMRQFYSRSNITHIDGMSLVFLGKFLGANIERKNRITYVDWIYPLMHEAANKNYRVLFIGSKPGVAAKASNILKAKIGKDKLQLETIHGYFDVEAESDENIEVLKQIKEYQPHILLVGMGMPRQEFWILENLRQIEANVILCAGACFDYVAGEVPTPPRWMGQIGLEWLYRLVSEPRRLWRRYLVEPWFIFKLILIQITKNNDRQQKFKS